MIVGAGLAGLIAAHIFPNLPLVDARPEPTMGHNALLRFRSSVVGDVTGQEFRPVTVRKAIWAGSAVQQPSIRLANLYSMKVVGRLANRSIWDLEPVTRWIAPPDFHDRLVESVGDRVTWGELFDFTLAGDEPTISTAPMPTVLAQLGIDPGVEFVHAPIKVRRYRVDGADVHQTIYFPGPETQLYRASITGDLLICEFVTESNGLFLEGHDETDDSFLLRNHVAPAFGISANQLEPLPAVDHQRYGKIIPIPTAARKSLLRLLTERHGIYSLGRFATFRNILLDDVVQDANIIKRLIAADDYERRLAAL